MTESVCSERDRIIEALSYPRSLMEKEIKRRDCPEHHRFNEHSDDCNDCLYILECQSYADRLSETSLKQISEPQLRKLLQLGLEYVAYQTGRMDHETDSCTCDLCRWVRETTPLLGDS